MRTGTIISREGRSVRVVRLSRWNSAGKLRRVGMEGMAALKPMSQRGPLFRRVVLALIVVFAPLTFLAAAIKGKKA